MWSNKQNSRKYYLSSKTSNITLWLLQPTLGLKNLKSIQTARSFLNLILTCQPIPLDRVYFFHSCIPNNWPVSPPINLFYPPFTSIYLDLPQFTSIYPNLPQFTPIYLDWSQFTAHAFGQRVLPLLHLPGSRLHPRPRRQHHRRHHLLQIQKGKLGFSFRLEFSILENKNLKADRYEKICKVDQAGLHFC